jgi:hypothetical protein
MKLFFVGQSRSRLVLDPACVLDILSFLPRIGQVLIISSEAHRVVEVKIYQPCSKHLVADSQAISEIISRFSYARSKQISLCSGMFQDLILIKESWCRMN